MKINLAGFNVDLYNIEQLKKILNKYPDIKENEFEKLKKIEWTPETLSASYARISRDPNQIGKLRESARNEIEKARKSNKAIIFDMGHSSVAEHAIFNIDIIDISRYLAEKVEKSRLVSFTEKSQRYIKIGKDIYYPGEFNNDKDILNEYKKLANDLFDTYNILHDKILPYFLDKFPSIKKDSREYKGIVNLAKEDARYILPLSTLTQLGMTINARSLEKIIRKLLSEDLLEAKLLGRQLCKVVEGYAPSLVKYIKPTDYEAKTYSLIKETIGKHEKIDNLKEVNLVDIDENIEEKIIIGFLLKTTILDYQSAKKIVEKWDINKKKEIFSQSVKHLNSYDQVLREFELPDFTFNIIISATAFAQLKRHRMATIIDGEYSPSLGVKIPVSILESNQKDLFMEKIYKIEKFYEKIKIKSESACNYILSNSHRKNIILKCNFRELVHISRLRSDKEAQWDIRNISDMMINQVKPYLKIIGSLLSGKDQFEENINKIKM